MYTPESLDISSQENAEISVKSIAEALSEKDGNEINIEIKRNELKDEWFLSCHRNVHGNDYTYNISPDFLASRHYKKLRQAHDELNELLYTPGTVRVLNQKTENDEKVKTTGDVDNFTQAVDWLLSNIKSNMSTQRFKGLGEMNAEQLWETTMDPTKRRLLKVGINDAIEADRVFTMLMGDAVDDRKKFIQSNALEVSNLDI